MAEITIKVPATYQKETAQWKKLGERERELEWGSEKKNLIKLLKQRGKPQTVR